MGRATLWIPSISSYKEESNGISLLPNQVHWADHRGCWYPNWITNSLMLPGFSSGHNTKYSSTPVPLCFFWGACVVGLVISVALPSKRQNTCKFKRDWWIPRIDPLLSETWTYYYHGGLGERIALLVDDRSIRWFKGCSAWWAFSSPIPTIGNLYVTLK